MTFSPQQQPFPQAPQDLSEVASLHCAAHPLVETNLRCGKCNKPICPKCLVQTPVGARCTECAHLRRSPTYQVSPAQYLKALGAAWGVGVVLGVVWGFVAFAPFFFYLNFLVAMGVGYVLAEVTGLAVNRKRGRGLQIVAGVGVSISFFIGLFRFFAGGLLFFPVASLFNPWNWLALALGIYIAAIRLR